MSRYKGPRVICERCGALFAQPQTLNRHRREGRCPGRRAVSLAVPVRSERSSIGTAPASVRSALAVVKPTSCAILPEPHREELAELYSREPERSSPFSDRDRLWAQYYALRTMAVKLDAGAATIQEEMVFRHALAEYDSLFDRLKTAKALPASADTSRSLRRENLWLSLI